MIVNTRLILFNNKNDSQTAYYFGNAQTVIGFYKNDKVILEQNWKFYLENVLLSVKNSCI